jgi:hypothetical protein
MPHVRICAVFGLTQPRSTPSLRRRTSAARRLRIPRQWLAEDPELTTLVGDPAFEEILKALPPDGIR